MPDVAFALAPRTHDQFALRVEEGKKRKALTFAADFLEHGSGASILELFVSFVFVDHEFRDHKLPFEDRLDFFGLDKLIESAAPPSRGCVEAEEYSLVLSGGGGPGFGEDFFGGRNRRRAGGRNAE